MSHTTTGAASGWTVQAVPTGTGYTWSAYGPRGSESGVALDRATAEHLAVMARERLTSRLGHRPGHESEDV